MKMSGEMMAACGWQALDPGNVPPDILVDGAWEWKRLDRDSGEWFNSIGKPHERFAVIERCEAPYRIRRPEGWEPSECPTCGSTKKEQRNPFEGVFVGEMTGTIKDRGPCPNSWHNTPTDIPKKYAEAYGESKSSSMRCASCGNECTAISSSGSIGIPSKAISSCCKADIIQSVSDIKAPTHEDEAYRYINKTHPTTLIIYTSPELYHDNQIVRQAAFMAFIAGLEFTIPPES